MDWFAIGFGLWALGWGISVPPIVWGRVSMSPLHLAGAVIMLIVAVF